MRAKPIIPVHFYCANLDRQISGTARIPDIDIAFGIAGNGVNVGELAGIGSGGSEGGDLFQAFPVEHTHAHIMAVGDIENFCSLSPDSATPNEVPKS